ncbi:hypothetical protein CNMCM5793_008773 [Aspergillus hiratsukae]|uniref:Uncharacterized protein n=1 Tax=Aspergillus hiratsukae TaxID=1194566 RepID=A0A8H6P1D6_9EURO|nr:hypothetical protein CNMCM5793_008773 [Aspergillus hiratsukae]KAF7157961.1 hypothetical protein CNMCM6106_004250 [Aspergillus hiratsukae]
MKTFQLVTLSLVGALVASASPAPAPAQLEKRGAISVRTWSGSGCSGSSATVIKSGFGTMCAGPKPGSSFEVLTADSGCTVTTWSGIDCRGSSAVFANPATGCTSIPFGSVSITC